MNRIINLELVELVLENVFEGVVIEQEPFPVFVDYVGENSVKVWNSAYSKTIKMKDTFLDDFFGTGGTYEKLAQFACLANTFQYWQPIFWRRLPIAGDPLYSV